MPKEKVSMRKIKEVLRLRWEGGLSHRAIARSCGIGETSSREYVRRARDAGLSWPLPEALDDAALEDRLFASPSAPPAEPRPVPDWGEVHQELKRKGVTLLLLWQEYKQRHPNGYRYSQFCVRYRQWAGTLDVRMRQDHKAGEKLFVDYAGQTVPVRSGDTGEDRQAQIFVAVLGASNYTYIEAMWTQSLPEWIMAHVRAFEYIEGCPAIVVPDNLRSAVSKACRYEPDLNPTYHEFARYYSVAVLPARPGKPRDKAPAEQSVQFVERAILAPLRHRTFFSLGELNRALWVLLETYNARPFQKLAGSRKTLFETMDRPALRPLPAQRYEYADWKKARVNIDYHIDAGGHYYSVPYTLARQEVDVRMTVRAVEIFHRGQRVASHMRCSLQGRHTTVTEHMPKHHQAAAQEWSAERFTRWAQKFGPATVEVVTQILASRQHPEQGYRPCLGLLRLGESQSAQRLEAACARALAEQLPKYGRVKTILEEGLDTQPLPEPVSETAAIQHPNLRGPEYFTSN